MIVISGEIMKALHTRKTKAELQRLENMLGKALVPVAPRPEFRETLQAQLRAAPATPEITRLPLEQAGREKMTLIGLAGIFSILMIAAAGARTIVAILGAVGLAGELSKQLKTKKTGPPIAAT